MSTGKALHARSESKCELCRAVDALRVYRVLPSESDGADESVLIVF